ncbi:uncharacterized protein LOC109793570, partial [Cajanus cajan]|uniref:uncharacterized protein LOC109793570 n=1 Tax=Cajanus cajan TaxID=3821 RepID=UPI00098D7F3D
QCGISSLCHFSCFSSPLVASSRGLTLRVPLKQGYQDANFQLALRTDSETLKIPNFFFKKWGNELSSHVTAEDQFGNTYQIKVNVCLQGNKEVALFGEGIKTIVQSYALDKAKLIFFQYLGDSNFVFTVCACFTPITPPNLPPHRSTMLVAGQQMEQNDRQLLWSSTITAARRPPGKPLAIPANMVFKYFRNCPHWVNVFLPNGTQAIWHILWYPYQGLFSKGWYDFQRVCKFNVNDKVHFWTKEGGGVLEVSVTRA